MARVSTVTSVSNLSTLGDLARYTGAALDDISTQLAGNLTFASNISAQILDVNLTTVSSKIAHNLGRVPLMWIAGNYGSNQTIWQTQNPDSTFLYLVSNGTLSAKVMVI